MMCATFKSNPCTTIVSYYCHINASDETDFLPLYNELSYLVRHIPNHNIPIISGDTNQYKAKTENKFSLRNLPKRNGEYLAESSLKKRLAHVQITLKQRGKLLF